MDTLPTTTATPPQTGGMHKETELPQSGLPEQPSAHEVGQEQPLVQEVSNAGVRIHPTTIPIPAPLKDLGVQAVGENVAAPVIKPTGELSDEKIAEGLKMGMTSSFMWLAVWWERLKKIHKKLQPNAAS